MNFDCKLSQQYCPRRENYTLQKYDNLRYKYNTNMKLKQIITFMNKNSNYVKNIISMVIKEGVMDFFSHSCLFLQSIYNSKPKDCVIIILFKISHFFNFAPVYDNTYNIIKDHSGFSLYHVDSRIISASIVSYEDGLKGIMICDRFL